MAVSAKCIIYWLQNIRCTTCFMAAVNPQGRLAKAAHRLPPAPSQSWAHSTHLSGLSKYSDPGGWFPFSLFPRARGGRAGGVPVPCENAHWTCGCGSCLAASPCHVLGPSEYFPQAPGNWNTVSASGARGWPSCRQPLLQSEPNCDLGWFPAGRWAWGKG